MGPLKVLIDGSLNTRTAYCVDPYPHGGRGLLTVSESELLDLLVRARESGFVPAVHAIGDGANEVALDAFAAAGIAGRIEHAQFVRQQDFARFGELGLTASVQPAHALDDRDAADSNWAGPHGPGVPAAVAARCRGHAGARLGRAGGAAGAVDRDVRGHHPGAAGRPRALAPGAGPHPAGGPDGVDARAGHSPGRRPGRPRRARRRSAGGVRRRVRGDAGGRDAGGGAVHVRRLLSGRG